MRVFGALFKRSASADDVDDYTASRMGVSMAATWSWGAAIAVGIAIMHNKGLLPFIVWTIGNVLSIPAFGYLYSKVPNVKNWQKLPPFVLLWAFIGVFAIVMNLNALKAGLGGGVDIMSHTFMPEPYLTPFVMAVGLGIAWFIHKKGIRGSVLTDVGQFALQFIGAGTLIIAGLLIGARGDVEWHMNPGSGWMPEAFLGIISGATASGMQWQRIEHAADNKKYKSTLYGGLYFGIFMILVTICGYVFDGSFWVSVPFLITVIAVATSTTDSGAASLQFVTEKFKTRVEGGSILAVVATVIYPLVSGWGLVDIWSFYAGVRWKVIAVLLVATLIYNAARKVWKKD